LKLLSELISRTYCAAAVPAGPDRFFAVGCQSVKAPWLPVDAGDVARIDAQVRSLERSGHLPWEPDQELDGVFNDLFSPFREDQDGKLTVWLPVPIEEPLTSSLLVRDWRAFALAWWATRRLDAKPDKRVVIVAFDASGRTISAEVQAADLYAGMDFAINKKGGVMQTPGASCMTCALAPTCKGLDLFISDLGSTQKPGQTQDEELRGLRLFNERAAVSMKIDHLEGRKDTIDAEISKQVKDGKYKMGPDQILELPARTTAVWDFAMVRRTLMAHGLWDDAFGSIRAAEIQKALDKFPVEVQEALKKARTERTNQPSISEAMRHGRYSTRPATFGGVTLRSKGGLGKG
jgi:hypothetical protein